MVNMNRETRWVCHACFLTDVTFEPEPHTRFHLCRRTGLTMPMLEEGVRCELKFNRREDYVNGDDVQMYAGKPVMNLVITRDDGQDCVVYAPAATVGGEV